MRAICQNTLSVEFSIGPKERELMQGIHDLLEKQANKDELTMPCPYLTAWAEVADILDKWDNDPYQRALQFTNMRHVGTHK